MTSADPTDDSTASGTAPPRRIVFAAILVDDDLIQPIGRDDDDSVADGHPGFDSMPLRFLEQAGPWGVAASLAIGTTPLRHGVLTPAALDESTLEPRMRRASDADRPWIWDRFAAEGRSAVVVAWPGIVDAQGAGVPLATPPAVMAPWMLASLAQGRMPVDAPPAWQAIDPERLLPQMVSPIDAAPAVARAAIEAASTRFEMLHDPNADRMVELILAAANALDSSSTREPDKTTLWAVGVPLRSESPGDAEVDGRTAEEEAVRVERIAHARSVLLAVLRRLARAAGEDGVLLAAAIGRRHGRLWHTAKVSARNATAIDLVPTILQLAGLPVSADLAGESLLGKIDDSAKSWDAARWSLPETDSAEGIRRPAAGALARSALAAFVAREEPVEGESRPPVAILLSQHFEVEWAIALMQPDWKAALSAATALVELHGREIDLWRVAFAAYQGDEDSAGKDAAARLRAEHPDSLSARLLPLLCSGMPPIELVESIDLADLRPPTQRSIVGRAAARLGLDEICRKALAPLVAHGLAIPADRIALTNTLLTLGEGQRALAALGGFGAGAESAGRLRILRARCLAAAGHRDRAIALLERYLVQAPFDGEARTLRDRLAKGE
jgi:hypothetical protein